MLKILIASDDTARLAEINRLATIAGNFQTTSLQEGLARLPFQASRLRMADLLVLDLSEIGPAQMFGVETLRQQHPELPCILITQSQDSSVLIQAMRAGVRDVLPWPLDKGQLVEALKRVEATHVPRMQEVAQVISMISCKGGAGTSFVAANLGDALARHFGKRVLVVDLNRYFGDLTYIVTDKAPPSTLSEICSQIDRMDAAFLEACLVHVDNGFDMLAGAADPVRASQIQKEKLEWILSVMQPNYDYVIFDVGQSIDPLSISMLDHSDRICVVTEPSIAFGRPSRRLLDILRALHYPDDKIRVVLNRVGRKNEVPRTTMEEIFGMKVAFTLPDDPAAVDEAVSHGEPVAKLSKRSSIARALQAMAMQLAPTHEAERRGRQEGVSPLRKLMLRARST
ncbi:MULTISPECIES: AAA family ATPase [Cupriavidus]|jgi:pilus assembly protein CpaE|uniref:Response regulator n=1 Tax=Cupriavidus metallidurans TaxID=119219 RepID=A0A132HJ79_9BURK|nr:MULTISPECIES: AAA family ATPase [Cupriavidus]KWR81241.1 pilus assembly protein CpaE [Cupriavidus sp. SHE]KWW36279.1 Sporulation initiation inhibitor protein Soj [Cupriavidus metallidurans]QBP08826.1 response regulator [Cupriavidus metallidurans]QWC89244.1 AAA family ATPase [Cupriavidus metallidurans]